jgi:hypothetical protein
MNSHLIQTPPNNVFYVNFPYKLEEILDYENNPLQAIYGIIRPYISRMSYNMGIKKNPSVECM